MRDKAGDPAIRDELARIATDRLRAARRALETARLDPRVPDCRIAFLHCQIRQAERAIVDLTIKEFAS